MDLSIVIPTVRPQSEIEVIRYLDDCTYQDYEVIIREDYPVTKARNEGFRRASAEKILFLDDDSMPRDGYLREASETLEVEDAVAGRTVHPKDDLFAGDLTSHYEFGEEPQYVDRFWGCNMGIRKEVLEAVGGWDEDMGWGHEDKELAERVIRKYDIYYNPEMVVDHVYVESLFDYWKKHYKLEKETPYYLQKKGLSRRNIAYKSLSDFLSPMDYLGRSASLTVARSGRQIVTAAGRTVGLLDDRLSQPDETANSPKPQTGP